jgi:hypothetical protein
VSPSLSNETVQPGPSRSTNVTFCFGAGAHAADFAILSDAVSQPHRQHLPSSTESEGEPTSLQRDNAIRTQIAAASIACMLVRMLQAKQPQHYAAAMVLLIVRTHLFVRRTIGELLDPRRTPPPALVAPAGQHLLSLCN